MDQPNETDWVAIRIQIAELLGWTEVRKVYEGSDLMGLMPQDADRKGHATFQVSVPDWPHDVAAAFALGTTLGEMGLGMGHAYAIEGMMEEIDEPAGYSIYWRSRATARNWDTASIYKALQASPAVRTLAALAVLKEWKERH